MKKLFLVLLSITPNPNLISEKTNEIVRQNNLRIAKSIIDSEDPFVNVYLSDPTEEIFKKPFIKKITS